MTIAAVAFGLCISGLVISGCADREAAEVALGSSEKADAQLAKAEEIMEKLGVKIKLEELATLNNPQDLLPDPEKLIDKQADLEDAIDAFNQVLASFGEQLEAAPAFPLAPQKPTVRPSTSDLALVHLNLTYLYMLEAVSILLSVRSELYTISFPKAEKQKGQIELYKFELTKKGKEKFDDLDRRRAKSSDYIKTFSSNERQAIIDSIVLLTGAKVRVKADSSAGISEQTPKVNKEKHRGYALYHAEQAVRLSAEISPEVQEGLDKFDSTACKFLNSILKDVEKWGFEVELSKEVRERCRKKEAV
jgi:hypothetical protein